MSNQVVSTSCPTRNCLKSLPVIVSDLIPRYEREERQTVMPRSWSESDSGVRPPATNGLSSWYDHLRRKPSLLSSSLLSSSPSSSVSSCSYSKLSSSPDQDSLESEACRDCEEEIVYQDERSIFDFLTEWISRVRGEDFLSWQEEQMSPVNPRVCVTHHGSLFLQII